MSNRPANQRSRPRSTARSRSATASSPSLCELLAAIFWPAIQSFVSAFRRVPHEPRIESNGGAKSQHHHPSKRKHSRSGMDGGDLAELYDGDNDREQENLEHVPRVHHLDDFVSPGANFFPVRRVDRQ